MAQNTEKWGKATAKARYGSQPTFSPPNQAQQAPQFPEDQHGPQYDNVTPKNWLRGTPNAEGKPAFDKHRARR